MNEDEKLRQFNAEHDKAYSTPPPELLQNQGTPGQAPVGGPTPAEQSALREMEANIKANNPDVDINPEPKTAPQPTPVPVPAATAPVYTPPVEGVVGSVCHECGTMHPPIPAGQKCPNAKLNLPSITDEEIGEFLVSMRNIIISQAEKNKVKDVKKLFQQSIVVLSNFLEAYTEEEE